MFTGIVAAMGTVRRVEDHSTTRRFFIETPELAPGMKPGDSVSVDGACLTAVTVESTGFFVDVIGTTLAKTVAGLYAEESRVNLEPALRVGDRLDGHFVQGHIDGIGEIKQIRGDGEFWHLDVEMPSMVADLALVHGSICINGVSLTIAEIVDPRVCRIGLIPFTFRHTNLGLLAEGDGVNVEGDLLGKYVAKILSGGGDTPLPDTGGGRDGI
ncbi:MAG: riboflavin synthase [Gemmatimonadota bacterium]|nr:riboflavin synthase [Gemmatimonadota bacterium]